MKRIKKVIALILIVVTMFLVASIPASAAYKNTGKSFTLKEGGFLGIGSTSYKYKIYKDSNNWYLMFHNFDVCPAIYHTKNRGATNLTYSKSRTYNSQTAYNFSVSAGLSAGKDLVNGTVGATGGMSKSYSYSVTASGSVGRTIPSSAKTGYYKMTICYNFDKYRLDKYKGNTYQKCYYAALPKGSAYVAVLYGNTSSNSSYAIY